MDDKAALKADFEQLQREYKNMEAMRKAYSEESLGIIRKQKEAIEKFQQDNEVLKEQLEAESRFAQRRALPDEALSSLTAQIEEYSGRLDVERRNIDQLTKQIEAMQAKLIEKRRDMGGVNAAKENQLMISKQIRILENRLEKALVKFNESLASNKRLREQIESLRQERSVFDSVYKRMETQLAEKKRQMAAIIEASNQAYEARDAAQLEIAAVQQSLARERQQYEEAIIELNRQIEHGSSLRDLEDSRGMDGVSEEEARLKSEVSRGMTAVDRDRAIVASTRDKVAAYEEGFNKIRAATGIASIEELVATFIQNEDQNFSLFNYVAEQSNEIERLEDTVASLKAEESKHGEELGDDAHQHKQLLTELESKLAAADGACEKYEVKFSEASKTLSALKGGIQSLFSRIGCSEKAMSELLTDTAVTDNNIMQFLGVIEQRANEIMQRLATLSRETSGERSVAGAGAGAPGGAGTPVVPGAPGSPGPGVTLVSLLGHGPTTQHGAEALTAVDPPKIDDYSSDDEIGEDGVARPLSVHDLKGKPSRPTKPKRRG